MSRSPPDQTYGYSTHPTMAPNYYYDGAEEYVGDYSENDALLDTVTRVAATPNVTEIYRWKPAAAPAHEHYRQQNLYIPANYYYDGVPTPVPQRRPGMPVTYRQHVPMVEQRACYYPHGALGGGFRYAVVYSSPHIATAARPAATHPSAAPAHRQVARRHPITSRTPRYYRRKTTSNMFTCGLSARSSSLSSLSQKSQQTP